MGVYDSHSVVIQWSLNSHSSSLMVEGNKICQPADYSIVIDGH